MFGFFENKKHRYRDIAPDEIFLDSRNAPEFDRHHLEGRFEQPIGKRAVIGLGVLLILVLAVYAGRLWHLQISSGDEYTHRGENNRLRHSLVFASRGVIYDREMRKVVWNEPSREVESFARRAYTDLPGLSHVLGYVSYPQKDSSGIFYETRYTGKDGVEQYLGSIVGGINGIKIVETDALNRIVSQSELQPPRNGDNVVLSLDAELTSVLYEHIRELALERGFDAGAGVIMDIETGEILAMTSFPEFSPEVLSEGEDREAIERQRQDPRAPFLNRATNGLYTPGSIIKPFIALAALNEGVISPEKEIESTGELRIPNPYEEGEYSVFHDWKAHGWVDMREALAHSSNEYFFTVGGGHGSQEGVGVSGIEAYARAFGVGELTGIESLDEEAGVIPNPRWKAQRFGGEPWRLGDTYNTAIGQYGFQVTPLQMARAVGAIASGGTLVRPTFLKDGSPEQKNVPIQIKEEAYKVVKEGMRLAVRRGTARGLSHPSVAVAAKTGTAELGVKKSEVNSWVIGFFPYEKPRYSFAVVLEKGPRSNLVGATFVMRQVLNWMIENTPNSGG